MGRLTLLGLSVLGLVIFPSGIGAQSKEFLPDQSHRDKADYLDSAFYIESQDTRIFFRKWQYPSGGKAEKVVLIIHGLGFHGDPYRKIMNHLYSDEIIVYAMDLRGHGLSGNIRGELESNEKILKDIDNMITIIKADNPGIKIFLLGSSMGGVYALGYAIMDTYNEHISGVILAGAATKPHASQILMPGNIAYLFPMMFNRSKPVVHINGKRLEMFSSNQDFIQSRRHDSLSLPYVSIDYLSEIRRMQKLDKRKKNFARVSVPVLIQHGGKDKIADLRGAKYLMEKLEFTRSELIIYPESRHCLLWEPDDVNVVRDLLTWILKN